MRHYVLDANVYERVTIGETVSFAPLTGRMKIATCYSIFLRTSASSCQYGTDYGQSVTDTIPIIPYSERSNEKFYILRTYVHKRLTYQKIQPFTQLSWLPSRYVRQVGAWEANRQESAERSAYHVRECLWMPLAISLSAVIIIVSVLTPNYSKNDVNNHWRVVDVSTPCFGVSRRRIGLLYIRMLLVHPSGVARQ